MSDLIGKSALLKSLEQDKNSICSHIYSKVSPCDADELEEELEYLINNQPTVDAVPVEHGKWIIGSKPRCSVCGKSALIEYDRDDWLSYVPSNFCPHCGASMEKGE